MRADELRLRETTSQLQIASLEEQLAVLAMRQDRTEAERAEEKEQLFKLLCKGRVRVDLFL